MVVLLYRHWVATGTIAIPDILSMPPGYESVDGGRVACCNRRQSSAVKQAKSLNLRESGCSSNNPSIVGTMRVGVPMSARGAS